ncbi:MAG: restriction endonuclease subunit S, partial [Proteobacteria bacterium]|nr:restriction endonuclease subunit S [Pseudomonadota bacterium]
GTQRLQLEGAPSRARRIVKDSDTLLATVRPNLRSFWFARNPKVNTIASTGFVVLRANKDIDSRYLYYTVTNQSFTDYLTANAKGAAYPAVDTDTIERAEIYLPPLPAQRKIATILSAYDDLIENNLRRIEILEEMAHNLYREWFVKFRFPGHQHARFTDSSLGRIPEGWEVKALGSLIAEHIGGGWGNDVEGDKHTEPAWVIRGTDIPDARSCDFSKVPFRYHTKSNLKSRRLMPGDIVFEVSGGSKGQPLGRSLYVSSELLEAFNGDPVICASFCKRIQPDSEQYASELLYLSFLDAYVSGEIEQYQVQSTGISNYKWSDYLEKVSRCVPPIALQERFCELSVPLFSEIATLGRKNTTLRRTRNLLLPRLISGEVDVSELDIAVPEVVEA